MVKLLHLQDLEGPGLDCYRRGEPVAAADLAAEGARWPRFSAEAQHAGFIAAQALPMRYHEEVIGALTLLRTATGRLTPDELRIAQVLANVATISILHQRTLERDEATAGQLQSALNSRLLIEQATGMLAERRHIGTDQAFGCLRGYARDRGRPLSEVAHAIVHGELDIVG
jgi:transcriptional regulator with GAF, ATPase, and Fis domain